MQSFASGALQRKFAKKEGSWAFMQPILSSKVSMYNSLLLFCCKNHLFCAPMFPHRYCLVTLETGEESQMRESLAGTAWPELERDKKRILADHKWLRGKWRLHERREVSKYCEEERTRSLFCSRHDVWELYGWPYLLPNETDKWGGDELSRCKNSAMACKLRTGNCNTAPMNVSFATVVMISLMQTVADKFITVFSRKVTPVINHFLRKYLLSLFVINGSRWLMPCWDNMVTGLSQVMAGTGPEVLHVESINDQHGDNITRRVANDIIQAR